MAHAAQHQIDSLAQAPFLPVAARAAVWFAVAVTRWTVTRHTRKHLAKLDNHLLCDIGLSPEEAWRETTLPFWR
ncbi:DUF1127 domain-containing protein [Aliiroseovarius sp.]|uniref:DUF1127 domain-containing protein n=1 Tax=Aliiroseovarius sp. TaxID=1872442 RepID=UPI003BAB6C1A